MQYAMGIDIGGTTVKGGVVSERGKIIYRAEHHTNGQTSHGLMESIMQVIGELQRVRKPLVGIGIGAPGPVDPVAGVIVEAPNLHIGKNFPLRKKIEGLTKLSVVMDNDANVAALGESWVGAGRKKKIIVMITLGTGIGGGIIIEGKIFGGTQGMGGELGHIVLQANGPRDAAGHIGCFEALASGSALIREGRRRLQRTLKSAQEIDTLIRQGNTAAQRIMDDEGRYVGRALATFIHIFNPDMIIVGGKGARGFPFFSRTMHTEVAARTFPSMLRKVKIVRARLGEDAGIIGAARLSFAARH